MKTHFFNKDFYPTPEHVLDLMDLNISGQTILEPSAGKGDIIDYCKKHGASSVLFCEINEDLQKICMDKGRFLQADFLKVKKEDISHVTQIVMNPPFSKQAAHILHAWTIAPPGCEITSLANNAMIDTLRYERSPLNPIINDYGNTLNLGNVFNMPETERRTDVDILLIRLYKPIDNDNSSFDGFYMDDEPETREENGIMAYNEIQALVNSYIGAVKCWDEFNLINEKMQRLCAPVGMNEGFCYTIGYNKTVISKEDFCKALQIRSWHHIFNKMKMNKYLTSGTIEKVNKFVETQTKVPFTVKNIYKMFDIIINTRQQNFDAALVATVDEFTKHTHENRYNVEGWKTNSGHMLNKKFIINHVFEQMWNSNKIRLSYHSNSKLSDLTKVLCNLTGMDYDKITTIEQMVQNFRGIDTNRWYECGFFEFKGFKKGTIHVKFIDDKVWEQLNVAYAKIKGEVLPESTFRGRQNQTENTEMEGGHRQQPRTETQNSSPRFDADFVQRMRDKYGIGKQLNLI